MGNTIDLRGRCNEIVLDKHYTFIQAIADTTWIVNHNLGKFPAIQCVDSAKTIIEGEVIHTDTNSLTIKFNQAVSGFAYCN